MFPNLLQQLFDFSPAHFSAKISRTREDKDLQFIIYSFNPIKKLLKAQFNTFTSWLTVSSPFSLTLINRNLPPAHFQ